MGYVRVFLVLALIVPLGAMVSFFGDESGDLPVRTVDDPVPGARHDTTYSVSIEPELVIGGIDVSEEYEFFRVTGAAQLPDGRIAVVNGGTDEIRFYSSSGTFLTSLGGRGAGPGEFIGPHLLTAYRYDSLLIGDARRFSVVYPTDSMKVIGPMRFPLIPGADVRGRILLLGGGEGPELRSGGVVVGKRRFLTLDVATDEVTAVTEVSHQSSYSVAGENGGRSVGRLPLSVQPSQAPSPRGVYVTQGTEPEVREYDTQGNLRQTVALPLRARRVATGEYWEAVAGEPIPRREVLKRIGPPPRHMMPLVDRLVADGLGGVWVREFDQHPESRSPRKWLIIDGDGNLKGPVETPRDLYIVQIGQDFVLGIRRGELGVEYIARHDLTRPG